MEWNIVVKMSKNILVIFRMDSPIPVLQWGIGSSLSVSEFIVHSYCSTDDWDNVDLHLVHLPRCKLEGFSNASLMGQDLSCQETDKLVIGHLVGSYLILQFYNIWYVVFSITWSNKEDAWEHNVIITVLCIALASCLLFSSQFKSSKYSPFPNPPQWWN